MRFARFALIVGISIAGIAVAAQGGYAYVGSGDKYTKVLVEFGDGAVYAFGVSFSDPNTTGIGLLDIIEGAGMGLITQRTYYDYLGWMIEGISYNGDSNSGYGGGELWWHYWVNNPPAPWEMPWTYSANTRIAADGGADGWVYGRDGAPRLPGDATGDLNIDGADLGDLVTYWKQPGGTLTWEQGDFGGDGHVNEADLGDLVTYWGFKRPSTPPPGPPLPEPATILLLAIGAMAMRRRKVG